MSVLRRAGTLLTLSGLLAVAACATGDNADTGGGETTRPPATSTPGGTPDTSGDPGDPSAPSTVPAPAIAWSDCGDRLECGTLDVPLDHDDPTGATVSLALVRHLAGKKNERIGSLLVNPGGPGSGGTYLARNARAIYAGDLLDRFDIVGWDPRGTGDSMPAVDCTDDYDDYFGLDIPPADDAALQRLVDTAERFGQACLERSGDLLRHISTEDTARDMDLIRQALGEDTISYFGFSYGSELGSVWATMFPDTVRAAVFDGAADPTVDQVEGVLQQAAGFEDQLDVFLANCSTDRDCAFHNGGRAGPAYDQLMARLGRDPLVVSPDRLPVTRGVAYFAVGSALYTQNFWPRLERALADAQDGDGAGLLTLYDEYLSPPWGSGNEFEAFIAITCLDDPGPQGVEASLEQVDAFLEVAPRLGAGFVYSFECSLWPVDPVDKVEVSGAGAGPIVVIGTTGDAATPIESTRAMARAMEDGRFVSVEANQHTGYGVNRCIVDVVSKYLIDLEAPADGTFCE
jgi:pimeloyl-ACP methyl ester carboxylesterase